MASFSNVLPLRRGKLRLIDLPVIVAYCGSLLLLVLPLIYFRQLGSAGSFGTILFSTLVLATVLLAGPLLGNIRGTLAALLCCVGIILFAQSKSGTGIYRQQPQFFWIMAGWVVTTFVTGWIYEKRKMRAFFLSWGILALELFIMLLGTLIVGNTSENNRKAVGILAFIIMIFVFSLITAVLEVIMQAIVGSIHKKRQQTR